MAPLITANNTLTKLFFPFFQLSSLLVQRSWNSREECPPGGTKMMPLNWKLRQLPGQLTEDYCPEIIDPACPNQVAAAQKGQEGLSRIQRILCSSSWYFHVRPKLMENSCHQKRQDPCGRRPSGMQVWNTAPVKNPTMERAAREKNCINYSLVTSFRNTDLCSFACFLSCLFICNCNN